VRPLPTWLLVLVAILVILGILALLGVGVHVG
jgi:hypothetical protein